MKSDSCTWIYKTEKYNIFLPKTVELKYKVHEVKYKILHKCTSSTIHMDMVDNDKELQFLKPSRRWQSSQPLLLKRSLTGLLIVSYSLICLPATDSHSIKLLLDASWKQIFWKCELSYCCTLAIDSWEHNQSLLGETLSVTPKQTTSDKMYNSKDQLRLPPSPMCPMCSSVWRIPSCTELISQNQPWSG